MWSGRPVSVKTSIRLSLLGMILAVTAAAVVSHEFLRRRGVREAHFDRSLVFAASVASRFNDDATQSVQDTEQRCRDLMDFPWVLGAAVWGQNDELQFESALVPALSDVLRKGKPDRIASAMVVPVNLPATERNEAESAHLVYTPLDGRILGHGPKALGLLLGNAAQPLGFGGPVDSTQDHFWGFYAPVFLAAGSALILGAWWLRREVVRPIRALARFANSEELIDRSPDPFDRYFELATIARALASLQESASDWRNRAQFIERRVDTQIAQETRKISQDLRQIERESLRDPLTRAYNRRFLEQKYPIIFDAQKNCRKDLSLVMLDLDHFKPLNDNLGHAAGDEVLRFVGELLQQCIRSDDFAVRYGGDEFLLILPGVKADDAEAVARRILSMFTQRAKMMVNIQPAPTMTAGVANFFRCEAGTPTELIARADQALLAAKRSRKGAVHSASSGAAPVRFSSSAARQSHVDSVVC